MSRSRNGKTNGIAPAQIVLPDPSVAKDAEHWVFQWPTPAPEGWFSVEMNGLRENSEGVWSEVRVDYNYEGRKGNFHAPSKLNLMSSRSRKELANDLAERREVVMWKPPPDYMLSNERLQQPHEVSIRWSDLIDQACAKVIQDSREGNPFQRINTELIADPVVRYMIERMIPLYQISAIFCDGGGGKSWLAQYICLCIALGQSSPPFSVSQYCPILYLDWESDKNEIDRRNTWIARGMGISSLPDNMHYRRMERPIADEVGRVRQYIVENGIKFVALDSLGPATGGDILKAESPIRTMQAIRALGDDVTKLIVAHISKAEAKEDAKSTIYGNAFFGNLVRAAWELKRNEDRASGSVVEAALIHQKMNVGRRQPPIGINYSWDDAMYTFKLQMTDVFDNPSLARYESRSAEVLSHLRSGPKTAKELAELTHRSQPTISRITTQLSGQIAKYVAKGKPPIYYLIDRASDYADVIGSEDDSDD